MIIFLIYAYFFTRVFCVSRFAGKYHADNPHVFATAEVVFIVTFSVVMLHTDAHNSKVPKKMSKEEFIRNLRGIDNGKDINHAYLSEVYDRVTTNEIRALEQDRKAASLLPPRKRLASFVREAPALVRAMQERTRSKLRCLRTRLEAEAAAQGKPAGALLEVSPTLAAIAARFRMSESAVERAHLADCEELVFFTTTADDIEVVPLLFEIVWPTAAATFSVVLEESDDKRVSQLCLDGYRYGVRIACMFHLDVARTALINSLAKVTLLGTARELKPKNVEAIRVLLRIAHTEGNYLRGSWAEVLMCVSEFECLQMIARAGSAGGDVFVIAPAAAAAANGAASAPGGVFAMAAAAAAANAAAARAAAGRAGAGAGPVPALVAPQSPEAAGTVSAITSAAAGPGAAGEGGAGGASAADAPVRRGSMSLPAHSSLAGAGVAGARLADGPFAAARKAAAAAAAAAVTGQLAAVGAELASGVSSAAFVSEVGISGGRISTFRQEAGPQRDAQVCRLIY